MTESLNPAATQHMPSFVTAPGETDVLMVVTAVILALAVLMFGIVFFRLHTLPERMAHKSKKIQFEIVAVLGLIALFTHMHIFWIAGLLLALIDIPDLGNALGRIAGSVERIAGVKPGEGAAEMATPAVSDSKQAYEAVGADATNQGDGPTSRATRPRAKTQKELGHA